MIKMFQPYVHQNAIDNVIRVLKSSQLAEGPEVKAFEQEFGAYFKKRNVVAVNSGTAALELAYELAGIKKGDEVLTPVLTCTATNLPLVRRGAVIKWIDTDYDLNIDIEDLESKITPKTKAIVFVHFGGNNRGLKECLHLSRRYKIPLIEDAAQAIGSPYWGVGDYTCVSLQAIKSLTSGDGGLLITRREDDSRRAKRLRWFGYDREEKQRLGDTDLLEAGYKYHMNDISAAIGRGNLSVIDDILSHRKKLKDAYEKNGISAHYWFAYAYADDTAKLKEYLKEKGVESGVHHYRNDKYTILGGRQKLPKMDFIENKYLLLPLHMGMSVEDVEVIAQLVKIHNQ
jgi:dTDP-4-amino-4,6-dideoxygalactose transaminase